MSKFVDRTGQRFGRLIAVEYVGGSKWKCKCDCGNEPIVDTYRLTSGNTKSCWCLQTETRIKNGKANRKWRNGLDKKLVLDLQVMMRRCRDKNQPRYKYYGGGGIKVCNEWVNDPNSFIKWSKENGYEDGLTIDRIDVNGDYEPSNCRWVDMKTQGRNKSNTIFITDLRDGELKSLAEVAESLGIKYPTFYFRFNKFCNISEIYSRNLVRGLKSANNT